MLEHSRLLTTAALLALAATTAGAQTVIYADDFETGLGDWVATGQWHWIDDSTGCPASTAPFPSGSHAARFGSQQSFCTFGTSAGRLTSLVPVSIPATARRARLRFQSFELTECSTFSGFSGGNCGWDHRDVFVSIDLGLTWQNVWQGGHEGHWIEKVVDLTPFIGEDVMFAFEFDPIDSIWNDFLGWVLDDVQVEIDPPGGPSIYCVSKVDSQGCEPWLSYSGDATLSGPDDFFVTCTNTSNNVWGKYIWSQARDFSPFAGGTLCVQLPAVRTATASSLGTPNPVKDCSGSYTWHFSQGYLANQGVQPGTDLFIQFSARDPGFNPPFNTSLSNGVTVTVEP